MQAALFDCERALAPALTTARAQPGDDCQQADAVEGIVVGPPRQVPRLQRGTSGKHDAAPNAAALPYRVGRAAPSALQLGVALLNRWRCKLDQLTSEVPAAAGQAQQTATPALPTEPNSRGVTDVRGAAGGAALAAPPEGAGRADDTL